MKKFYLSLVLLLSVAIATLSAYDLSTAKRNLSSAQKELSQLVSKRDKEQQKQVKLQSDSVEALAKIEKYQDKPKSLPYKNAVKESESTNEKLVKNALVLAELNQKVDSMTRVVAGYELVLQNAQQSEYDAKLAKQLAKDSAKLAKQHEKELAQAAAAEEEEAEEKEAIVLPTYQADDNSGTEAAVAESTGKTKEDSDTEGEIGAGMIVLYWVLIIGFAMWSVIHSFRKKHHCPECGKWFTMEFDGDTHVWDHDSRGKITRRGFRKKYVCTNCGHETKFIAWF